MMKFTTIANAKKQTGLSYLGGVATSAKIAHSKEYSHQYTYLIYLAPAKESGYNVCSHSTPECRIGCLATSGHAGMELTSGKTSRIKDCRIKKTKLFYEEPEFFMAWLMAEIRMYQKKAIKDGYYFSVRLNGTSDIDWQNVKINDQTIFEIFPEVAFYDYTKNPNKYKNIAPNYHLTFSYTGRNTADCLALLKKGFNIAVVFDAKNEKEIPAMYKGFKVINGDLTDYRVADGKGIIVGLKFKHISNKVAERNVLNSMFVIKTTDADCSVEKVQPLELAVV